ncbi:MAG: hypothetical protein K8R58_14725 [Bacteroidales bacterium]|nr:hypothetical protein [Bacteroidales bacterium]
MQTYTVDIINERAIILLKDLESLKLIRLRKQVSENMTKDRWFSKYKGAMLKQPLNEIDQQLNELRNSWE